MITKQELSDLIEWAKDKEPLNGLVLAHTIWSGRDSLGFSDSKIFIPSFKAAQKAQPFTLAVVLNTGKGYRDLKTGSWKGTDLKAGDVVIAEQFVAFPIEIDGKKINYFPESTILAQVDPSVLDTFEDKVL